MHVLLLPSWYPEDSDDIRGVFFREQAIALREAGCFVGVVAIHLKSLRQIKSILNGSRKEGFEYDEGVVTLRASRVNWLPRFYVFHEWLFKTVGLKLFKQYISRYGMPDIIHVHSLLNAGLIAHEIKKRYRIPYIVTEHSSLYLQNRLGRRRIKMARMVASGSSIRIAVSQSFSSHLSQCLGSDVGHWITLPNIVSKKFFDTKSASVAEQKFSFLSVGFISRNKRIDILLKAFYMAFGRNSDIFLRIAGDGPERRSLQVMAENLGIAGNVRFLGMLSREEVVSEMERANVVVSASDYETFGVTLIEALSRGKPVIATRSGGPEDILNEENGILVPVADVPSMADAMRRLYREHPRYCAERIRQDCYERYGEQAVTSKLIHYYKKALDIQLKSTGGVPNEDL